jgi:hypothetical protein
MSAVVDRKLDAEGFEETIKELGVRYWEDARRRPS